MVYSRRTFLKQSLATIALAASGSYGASRSTNQRTTGQLLVNHVGFTPQSAKFCLARGEIGQTFQVLSNGVVVLRGTWQEAGDDLGDYLIGDFSTLQQAGKYQIRCNGAITPAFRIDPSIYDDAITQSINYFARQRCGASTTGYNTPCHLDDGVRDDNGQHLDVTGGWHDACDVRKWVNSTIFGMIGLLRVLELIAPDSPLRLPIVQELRWGNLYFQKMQLPSGAIMNYCGGDDANNWTDNTPGTSDDRPIHTEPADTITQFLFIAAQSALADQLGNDDPPYAMQCQLAATRCMEWVNANGLSDDAGALAARIMALVQLHRAQPSDGLLAQATGVIQNLMLLQQAQGTPAGYFRYEPDSPEPLRDIMRGNLPLIALSDALRAWPDHPAAAQWRESLAGHIAYLQTVASRSAFGIIPYGLYHDGGSIQGRSVGDLSYRYFMERSSSGDDESWWVGINAHLASHGVGLARAAKTLANHRASDTRSTLSGNLTSVSDVAYALAQRQLDWIIGVNPFNISTISGVGLHQPLLYAAEHLKPPTPVIKGGVMNGIGGSVDDQPELLAGSWQNCEYWTPAVAYTLWLMAELIEQKN